MDELHQALTELEVEMKRYVDITMGWPAAQRYRVMCSWMGTLRMREMNGFLQRKQEKTDGRREQPEDTNQG